MDGGGARSRIDPGGIHGGKEIPEKNDKSK